jgi:hypothetical protein
VQQEIKKRYEAEAKLFPILRDRFATQVVRWEFSTEEIWSYEDGLRRESSDADILPGPEGAFHACGYDRADRPVFLKHFDWEDVYPKAGSRNPNVRGIPSNETWEEEFIVHRGHILDVSRFVRGELEAVYTLIIRERLLIEEFAVRQGCFQHTRYQYEGRRKRLQQSLSENERVFLEIAFGPHGEQTYFRVRRDGTRFQLGQPLPKGMTVRSLKETIRNRLLALVPRVVAGTGIKEPIYCIALAYDNEGNDALPPVVGIGLESERQKWRAGHGKSAGQWIWNPAEFQHYEKPYTQLDDDALEEACDYWNGKLAENASFSPAIKLLVEVATELNQVPWPAQVKRTADFVVYAVDFELGSLRKNLKASLSAERWAMLKASNLI